MKYLIKKIVVGELQTNCYIIINEQKEAIIIDPGEEFEKIMANCKEYKLVNVLITHHHFDHVGALNEIKKELEKNDCAENHFQYEIIKTKGHTKDSVSFYFPTINSIFVGDFIFKESIGRMDLGGDKIDMKESIKKFLKTFNDDLIIYPGHGESTTLKEERENLEEIMHYL